jgi:hypothetical protein
MAGGRKTADSSRVSIPAGTEEISALSDAELGSQLSRLEREERQLSKRRTTLHNRIDFVRAGGYASSDPTHEQLTTLEAAEQDVSERRHELHRQIDLLRAESSRRHLRT